MKTKLYIDASDNTKTIVRLKKNIHTFQEISGQKGARAQITLTLIEKLLQKTGIRPEEIDEVKVKNGPGSYTGLKVGVSIANALSFALQRPVNGLPLGRFEEPEY